MDTTDWRTQDGRDLVLTSRQEEVLALIARGYTNAEIGDALGMTLDGAKWHVSEIIAKLGVATREEAVAAWRTSPRRRSGWVRAIGRLPGGRWLPFAAAGVAGLAAIVGVLALNSGDTPAAEPDVPSHATATPQPTLTPTPLTAEEILHRSEQAMAAIPLIRVETRWWPLHDSYVDGAEIVEYAATEFRRLAYPGVETQDCEHYPLPSPAFSRRSLGALANYPEERHKEVGASRPETFELLREEVLDGEPAWVIRYRFAFPSFEGMIPTEDTEWIAKSDFRLLRLERETVDRFGFIGQAVSIIEPIEQPSACPGSPEHSTVDLTPLTERRLTSDAR